MLFQGAVFSLRFDESGGVSFDVSFNVFVDLCVCVCVQKMSIPVEQGESRVFKFKTAPLREGDGHSSLECVHQALSSPQEHRVC